MYPHLQSVLYNKKENMKKNYEIASITPTEYTAVASTYAEVFAGEPWKEVSRCDRCSQFSSKSPLLEAGCTCGGTFNLEAYPLVDTAQYIAQELNKTDAIGIFLAQVQWLEQVQRCISGFGWGFKMTPEELSLKKYRTQEMQQLVTELLIKTGFFYYVSEVGVLPNLQGLGFGKDLTNKIVDSGKQKGYQQFVVRTNEDSPMRYILEKMGMRAIIGLQTGLKDTENEARVLFVNEKN